MSCNCGDLRYYIVHLKEDDTDPAPTFLCSMCRCKFYYQCDRDEHFNRVHKCGTCGDIILDRQDKAFHIRRHRQEVQLERLNEQQKREN